MQMSPLPPWAVRDVLYPFYRRLKRDNLLAGVEELESHERLRPEELRSIQWKSLQRFLGHINEKVPYYGDLFRNLGLHPEDVRTPADFLDIPLLTKDLIRSAGKGIITQEQGRRGVPLSTSGSTGEPLYFEVDTAAGPARRACAIRSFRWMGIDIGDRQARIWGTYFGVPLRSRLIDALKEYVTNVMQLSAFNMSEEVMHDYAARLKRFKPHLLIGFPSAITLFAEFCKSHRITGIVPRSILASGEKIYPHQKDLLEEVFKCPVYEGYGTNEFANVAHQCERRKGLHMFTDLFYLEVLHESGRPAEPGEVGEIVVTDLSNLYMPFLRYRTGDLAVPAGEPCPCGRPFPLLDRIEGRTFDVVVSPEGKTAGGFFWTFLSRAVPGIARFQIEQRDPGGVIFRLVPGPEWKEGHKAVLEKKIKANMGDAFRVDFEVVDDIPPAPSGKFRFIISKIEERLVVKSKIHKAHVTGEEPDKVDGIVIDEALLELANIAPCERVLIVDNDNGARVETFVRKGRKGSGEIRITGAAAKQVHAADEIIIMSYTWSDRTEGQFKNILVDEQNRFVRYLTEIAGEKI
jgi:phenylacetate-CoA ligase